MEDTTPASNEVLYDRPLTRSDALWKEMELRGLTVGLDRSANEDVLMQRLVEVGPNMDDDLPTTRRAFTARAALAKLVAVPSHQNDILAPLRIAAADRASPRYMAALMALSEVDSAASLLLQQELARQREERKAGTRAGLVQCMGDK